MDMETETENDYDERHILLPITILHRTVLTSHLFVEIFYFASFCLACACFDIPVSHACTAFA